MSNATASLALPPWKGDELAETAQLVYMGVCEQVGDSADHFVYKGVKGRLWKGSVNAVMEELWPAMRRAQGVNTDSTEVIRVKRAVNAFLRSSLVLIYVPPGTWWVRSDWQPRSGGRDKGKLQANALREAALQLVSPPEPREPKILSDMIPVSSVTTTDELRIEQVYSGEGDPVTTYEDVSPVQAAYWLEHNAAIRLLSELEIVKMARDMTNDRWRLTHQGLAFDPDGWLLDGQHRLNAIVRSGKTVRMAVTRNLTREAFDGMDIGRSRRTADLIKIRLSVHAAHELEVITRRALVWQAGTFMSRALRPTQAEILAAVEGENADLTLLTAAEYAASWKSRPVLTNSIAGFAWWLFNGCSPDHCQEFMFQMETGVGLDKGDPAYTLRERLLRERQKLKGKAHLKPEVPTALAIMAWNHYRRGTKITKLQLPEPLNDKSCPRPI